MPRLLRHRARLGTTPPRRDVSITWASSRTCGGIPGPPSPATSSLSPRTSRRGWCGGWRSEEHTSELQSQSNLVCRLLLEKKKKKEQTTIHKARHVSTDRLAQQ